MDALKRLLKWMLALTSRTNDVAKTANQFEKASRQFNKTITMMKKISDDVKEDLKKDDREIIKIERETVKNNIKIRDIKKTKERRREEAKKAENFAKGIEKLINNDFK